MNKVEVEKKLQSLDSTSLQRLGGFVGGHAHRPSHLF